MRDEGAARIDEERPDAHTWVLSLIGDADLDAAPELRARLGDALASGARALVVDLSQTTLLDSMALGVLVRAAKQARSSGIQIRLVVPHRPIRRIFEITLLDQVLPLHTTAAEALAAARTGVSGQGREETAVM